jgi:hypothetical protein
MNRISIDQYVRLDSECPMQTTLHHADDLVEIALGESRISGSGLRLQIANPETCARLLASVHEARDQLVGHLNAKPRC